MLLLRRSKARRALTCCRFNASRNASCSSRIASASLKTSLRRTSAPKLFWHNARLLDDLAPAFRFILYELAHVGRAAAGRQQIEILETLAGIGVADDLVDGRIELAGNCRRCLRGRRDRVP